jgi:carbon storage regulator
MLVLSRTKNERIRLGDSIEVTIIKVSGDKVRIGIEAPSDITILRGELLNRQESRPDAADGTTDRLAGDQLPASAMSA